MTATIPFDAQANAITLAVTSTASVSVALPNLGNTLRIVNEGPNIAFIATGASAQVATLPTTSAANTCTPVLAGSDVSFTISNIAVRQISAICRAAGTAALTIQVGEGV